MALDTLAAAYAENGQFEKATETAEKAVELASSAHQYELAKEFHGRLLIYKSGKPFRVQP